MLGAVVPIGLAFAILGAVWLVNPPAWYYLAAVLTAVVFFLSLIEFDHETVVVVIGLTAAAGTGGLVYGADGGTLGAWAFLVLVLLLAALRAGSEPASRSLDSGLSSLAANFFRLAEGLLFDPVLEVVLTAAGRRPVRWRRFLAYAEDALLLRRASGDHGFVHRLLRDYFALLDLMSDLSVAERRLATIRKMGFQGESAIDTLADCLHRATAHQSTQITQAGWKKKGAGGRLRRDDSQGDEA
jgi:hypothetical protein